MAIPTEIRLRLPKPKVAPRDDNGHEIDIYAVRFVRRIELPAVPRVADALDLETSQLLFRAVVNRVTWDDAKEMFVVECQYAKRQVASEHFLSIMGDPEWALTPLL